MKNPGEVFEIIQQIADKYKIKLRFKPLPWQTCLDKLKANRIDGIINASYNPERHEIGAYPMKDGHLDRTKRLNTQSYYLYVLERSSYKKLEDFVLRGTIASIKGYSVVRDLRLWGIPEVNILLTESALENLNLLYSGKVDAVADLKLNVSSTPHPPGELTRIEPAITVKDYFLVFSKKFYHSQPALAEAIWGDIATFRESEAARLLKAKYQMLENPPAKAGK